jgi:hypothetical protein
VFVQALANQYGGWFAMAGHLYDFTGFRLIDELRQVVAGFE